MVEEAILQLHQACNIQSCGCMVYMHPHLLTPKDVVRFYSKISNPDNVHVHRWERWDYQAPHSPSKLHVYPACGNSCSSGWIWSRHDWRCSRPTLPGSFMEITSHTDRRLLTFPLLWHYTADLAAGETASVFIFVNNSEVNTHKSMHAKTSKRTDWIYILANSVIWQSRLQRLRLHTHIF